MPNDDGFIDKLKAHLERLKEFMSKDIWQKSFLLKRRKKEIDESLRSIEAAKDDVLVQIQQIGKEQVVAKKQMIQDIPDGCMVVYIMISQKDGKDIRSWESALSALPSCSFGRPMYLKEDDVRHAVTAQGAKLSMGYVSIFVAKDEIISDRNEFDALGQPIISLKPSAINSNHILKFVHYNALSYFFVDKKRGTHRNLNE